jgi:hypothetical protein
MPELSEPKREKRQEYDGELDKAYAVAKEG